MSSAMSQSGADPHQLTMKRDQEEACTHRVAAAVRGQASSSFSLSPPHRSSPSQRGDLCIRGRHVVPLRPSENEAERAHLRAALTYPQAPRSQSLSE
uniref:Uncharacterized protein n=1 Tax=Knipowitschia caucasica TaxID=637954 RepID=A0AAV2KFH4_KNICA